MTTTLNTQQTCKNYSSDNQTLKLLIMTWPPHSPNLNPAELLWDELDKNGKESVTDLCTSVEYPPTRREQYDKYCY